MATGDGSMKIGMVIQAQTAQAKAALAELQTQIGAVTAETGKTATASQAAATATDQVTTSAASAAEAVNAWGETEAQVQVRLQGVARSAIEASNASTQAARAAVANADASRTAAGANAAQAESTAALVARQNAAMAVSSRVVAAQAEIATALKAKSLTEAQSLEVENMINRARAAGLISAAEQRDAIKSLAAIKVVDAKATETDTKAITENTAASALNYRSRREVGTIGAEALAGNFGRVRTSGLALVNDMGLFSKVLTPVGLGLTAVAAAGALVATAFAKGEAETASFNNALILTGGYAGKSSAALQAMAIQMDAMQGVTEHAAAQVVSAVAATGKFYGDQVQMVAKAALQMQQATGQSLDVTIKQFESLGSDPIAGLMKLNETMHFVTQAVYDQVTALQRQGETEQAAQVAQQAYADAVDTRTAQVRQNLGLLQSAWQGLKNVAKEAWDSMLNLGRSDAGETLQLLQQQMESNNALIRAAGAAPNAGSAAMQAYMHGLLADNQNLQTQISKLDGTAAKGAKELSDSLKAQQELAKEGITPLQTYLQKVAQIIAQYKTAIKGASADVTATAATNRDSALAKAQKAYESATRQPSGAGGAAGPDLGALQARAQVTAIQQSLTTLQNAWQNTQKTLDAQHRAGKLSDADYFDTLRKDLDAYTQQRIATLEQEKVAAEAHVKTAADRIRADQQVAKIDAEITQAEQDAAAKREQIDAQEQQAIARVTAEWNRLKRSIESPIEAHLDDFTNKLQKIMSLMGGDASRQQSFMPLLNDAVDKSALQQPRSASRFVTRGPGQQLGDATQAESAWFASQNAMYEKERAIAVAAATKQGEDVLKVNQLFDQKEQALAQTNAQTIAAIQQAKANYALDTAQSGFAALAQAMSNAYGENSKQARIAFALEKAASIAKATLAINTSIAESSKIGYPWNIVAIAGAVAQGVALLANVSSVQAPSGGYATGGHVRGAGSGTSDSIPAMLSHGEYVLRAAAVRQIGVPMLDAINRTGFANGGYVKPFADAPSPAELGFTAPARPRMDISKLAAANDARANGPAVGVRIVNSIDPNFATSAMNSAAGEKVIMNVLSRNATKLKQMVR